MSDYFPTFPHSCLIPNTEYILEAVHSSEFRMGAPYCNLRIKTKDDAVWIDISSWNCYPGLKATDFIKQSEENPNVLFFPVLIHENYRENETKAHRLYNLKLNIVDQKYRIAERSESETDISKAFYPIQEMPKLKKFLETHRHGKKGRVEKNKFY